MVAHNIAKGLSHEQFLARLIGREGYIGAGGLVTFDNNMAVRKYDIIRRDGSKYITVKE